MKLEFKREDFPCDCTPGRKIKHHFDWCSAIDNAEIANDRLQEMLLDAPMVYGVVTDEKKGPQWTVWRTAKDTPDPFDRKDTHKARLVNIEKLNSCEAQ